MSLFFSVARRCSFGRLIALLESADSTFWVGCTDVLPDCIKKFWGFLPFSSHYLPILLPTSSHHPPIILPTTSQQPPNNLPTFLPNHPEGIPKESRRMWWKGKRYGLAVWHTMVGSSKGYGCTVSGDKNLQLKGCLVVCPCTCERAWTNWAAPFLLNGFRMVLERE